MEAFLSLAFLHALAVVTPGPDFAIILRTCLQHHRSEALAVARGIATGVAIHGAYTLTGLGWILLRAPQALDFIRLFGGLWLLVMGLRGLLAPTLQWEQSAEETATKMARKARGQGFVAGLTTNLLNPNAALFTITLFTSVLPANLGMAWRIACALEMVLATVLWFSLLAYFLTQNTLKTKFRRFQNFAAKLTSLALFSFGIKLIWPLLMG